MSVQCLPADVAAQEESLLSCSDRATVGTSVKKTAALQPLPQGNSSGVKFAGFVEAERVVGLNGVLIAEDLRGSSIGLVHGHRSQEP